VAELITDPNTIIALSDAGAHASQLCDACYSTYLLGHWVRERKTFTIEQAVHNLTQRPAEMFGITDRGLLAEGRPADVVVFDPKTVGPGPLKRVYDLPAGADRLVSEASGIDAVIVNGKLIRRDGKDAVAANDKLPGRLLRHGQAASSTAPRSTPTAARSPSSAPTPSSSSRSGRAWTTSRPTAPRRT
jgi:N-acyl-D-amino-acid deacylase